MMAMVSELTVRDANITETVREVTKRESRRDKAGVEVEWSVAGTSVRLRVEKDTVEEARTRLGVLLAERCGL
jgi:hypothetical protein